MLEIDIQAIPATLLVKFEKGMQSKIINDASNYTKEKSFVGTNLTWYVGVNYSFRE